jgi:hypothetical protein
MIVEVHARPPKAVVCIADELIVQVYVDDDSGEGGEPLLLFLFPRDAEWRFAAHSFAHRAADIAQRGWVVLQVIIENGVHNLRRALLPSQVK